MSIGLPCRLDGFIQFSGNDSEMAGFSAIYEFQLQKLLALINLYACTVFCIFSWQLLRKRLMIAFRVHQCVQCKTPFVGNAERPARGD